MELAICERWSVLVQLLDDDDGVVGVVGVVVPIEEEKVVVVVEEEAIADVCCSQILINSHIQLAILRIVTSALPSRTSSKVISFPTCIENPNIPFPGSPDRTPSPADDDDSGGSGNEACSTW